ncbi:hypothetical protein BsWGS_12896 [Bradybaena similaris]
MTGYRCFRCLLFLTLLLLIYKTTGKPADNRQVYSDRIPLVGSAPLHEHSYHTHLEKGDHLVANVNNQESPVSTRLKVLNITDTIMTKLNNLNAKIGDNHNEAWRTEQMMANVLQDSRFFYCSIFPIACRHTKGYSVEVGSTNMSVGSTDYEHLKSSYSPNKLRNGYVKIVDNTPPVSLAEHTSLSVAELGNKNEDIPRTHSIISERNLNNTPKYKVRERQRTRFVRDTAQDNVPEGNHIWVNLPLLVAARPEVEFGISDQNDGFKDMLEDLAVANNAQYEVPSAKVFGEPSKKEFQTVPVIYNSPLESQEIIDSERVYLGNDMDNDISNRNIYDILQSLQSQSDDDSGDLLGTSAGFSKRDNRHLEKMHALLKQGSGDSVRAPLQDRPRRVRLNEKHERSPEKDRPLELFVPSDKAEVCHLESDGTRPLRCPSDMNRCLYDKLICDGTPNCPQGEDEAFTLCVLRHWIFKFMRKIISFT